jgi:ribonuclease HI
MFELINNKKEKYNVTDIEYLLQFDGCSKGNPGVSGIGAVLYFEDEEIWCSNQYIGIRTNNENL